MQQYLISNVVLQLGRLLLLLLLLLVVAVGVVPIFPPPPNPSLIRYKSTDIVPWSGRGGGGVGVTTTDYMREEQHQIIAEQDQGLEHLSRGLRKQQKMGLAMQDEIQDHIGVWLRRMGLL